MLAAKQVKSRSTYSYRLISPNLTHNQGKTDRIEPEAPMCWSSAQIENGFLPKVGGCTIISPSGVPYMGSASDKDSPCMNPIED